jgi:hypothetical protein
MLHALWNSEVAISANRDGKFGYCHISVSGNHYYCYQLFANNQTRVCSFSIDSRIASCVTVLTQRLRGYSKPVHAWAHSEHHAVSSSDWLPVAACLTSVAEWKRLVGNIVPRIGRFQVSVLEQSGRSLKPRTETHSACTWLHFLLRHRSSRYYSIPNTAILQRGTNAATVFQDLGVRNWIRRANGPVDPGRKCWPSCHATPYRLGCWHRRYWKYKQDGMVKLWTVPETHTQKQLNVTSTWNELGAVLECALQRYQI